MKTEHKLLNDAAEYIVKLRDANEKMSIRLTAIDDMLCLVKAGSVTPDSTYTPKTDVVRDIDEYLHTNLDDLTQAVRNIVTKRKLT